MNFNSFSLTPNYSNNNFSNGFKEIDQMFSTLTGKKKYFLKIFHLQYYTN
ncbi:hypothetical protein [Buchnera aphidicola]|nr:hypothetical protein [Buchnera aphidicola]